MKDQIDIPISKADLEFYHSELVLVTSKALAGVSDQRFVNAARTTGLRP
jgi:hypothetical protein